MRKEYPELSSILLNNVIYRQHCKDTNVQLSKANLNTLVALLLLTGKSKSRASLKDLQIILHEFEWRYTPTTITEHTNDLIEYGFAKEYTSHQYRITKQGKNWLEAFDKAIDKAPL